MRRSSLKQMEQVIGSAGNGTWRSTYHVMQYWMEIEMHSSPMDAMRRETVKAE
jgi:hypothetical protein